MKFIAAVLIFASFTAVMLTNGVTYCAGADGFAGYSLEGCRKDAGEAHAPTDHGPACWHAPLDRHGLVPLDAGMSAHAPIHVEAPAAATLTAIELTPACTLACACPRDGRSPPQGIPIRC